MQFLKRLKPMTDPRQNSTANTIYVDSDTDQIKVGVGASGNTERILGDSVEGHLAPDGSASAPSFAFASEPELGWYRSSTDTVSLSNGGQEIAFNTSAKTVSLLGGDYAIRFGSSSDVSLSRGGADRLNLAAGDSFRIVSGSLEFTDGTTFIDDTAASGVLRLISGDGIYQLGDGATLVGVGGLASSFPALKRSSANLQVRLADDSGYGTLHTGNISIQPELAIPAGGTTGTGLRLSATSNFGVFFGSGAPTLSAAQGSLYLRSDGSSTTTRAYINTDGGTTWTAITTVS